MNTQTRNFVSPNESGLPYDLVTDPQTNENNVSQ